MFLPRCAGCVSGSGARVLDAEELYDVAASFGATEEQVRRDHFISHILAAIAGLDLPVTFFGGTALARTHLSDPTAGGRLSEDIDLCTPLRREVAAELTSRLPVLLRRDFPDSSWSPALTSVRAVDPAQLVSADGLLVRIQLLDTAVHTELSRWPCEPRNIMMRYRDVAPTRLEVPTVTSFAAMKTVAWMDRQAPRDLYDLGMLAKLDALTAEAAELLYQTTGWRVAPHTFRSPPPHDWELQLAHQTRELPSAHACLSGVAAAYGRALDWIE